MSQPRMIDLVIQLKKKCILEEDALGRRLGLTPQETFALAILTEHEQISCNEFSKRLGLSPSRGSRTIEKLLRQGLLVRKLDTKDRRAIHVSLSKKGAELRARSESVKNECERDIKAKIPAARLDQVRESMEILLRALS